MIVFKLTTDKLNILKQEGFYPDTMITQFFILFCHYNKHHDVLEALNDNEKSKRIILQNYELVRKGFLQELSSKDGFEMTDKGRKFYEKVSEFGEAPLHEEKIDNFDDFFEEWLALWPSGVKTGGKLVKSDKAGTKKKMQSFLKNNNFKTNTVWLVTEQYINEFARNNYEFMKSATYFIDKKGEGSELAARCEEYLASDKETQMFETQNNSLI